MADGGDERTDADERIDADERDGSSGLDNSDGRNGGSELDEVASAFTELAAWCEGSSELYERLCRIVADDPELLELAAAVPDDRSTANVFLAALQFRLLRGADGRLAEYYPSVTDDAREPDGALGDALRDFCAAQADALRPLLRTRRTQTNAVRRCAALYPAVARVAREVDGPLALVELGPSAGLNLLFDRYRYDYGDAVAGAVDSPVTIRSEVAGGDPPLPDDPPAVRSRVGIDLHPMDVTDPDDADWLRSLVWPDLPERRRALDDALALARRDPPRVVEGDLLDDLPDVLGEIPSDVPVLVVSTLVLYQLPPDAREAVRETLAERAGERPLHWLSGDDELGENDGIRLEWTRAVDGEVRTDLLAGFEQHGRWIEWYGSG
ncbi:DUF2332 domain-containing protein [Halomicrobium salinisoli]|uniref:DUF2332 domain-containing protein n=1 Tax=Halomicrobium salinisoli TaxID=2878391 RepID=UPI001CEFEB1E|nr:DUF2332 domain-containing protein [Halomicrobium salinisoli]